MKTLMVSAGEPPSDALFRARAGECQLLIAVDGGLSCFERAGIAPHIMVGDMDSAAASLVQKFAADGAELISAKAEKDDTDSFLALEEAISRGAKEVVWLGATGGRVDHLLSNLMLLKWAAARGVSLAIEDDTQRITLGCGSFEIEGSAGDTVSLIPVDERATVSAQGLKYPLDDLVLKNSRPRGVSNVLEGERAAVDTDAPLFVLVLRG